MVWSPLKILMHVEDSFLGNSEKQGGEGRRNSGMTISRNGQI